MLHLIISAGTQADVANQLVQHRRSFQLEPYIFFTKSETNRDPIWEPASLLDIEIVINGVVFFKINRTRKQVLLGFGGSSSDLFVPLGRVLHQFESLTLCDTAIPEVTLPGYECKGFATLGCKGHDAIASGGISATVQKFGEGFSLHEATTYLENKN